MFMGIVLVGCGSSASPTTPPKQLVLRLNDLPTGFTVRKADAGHNQHRKLLKAHGWRATYEREFSRSQLSGLIDVVSQAVAFEDDAGAKWGIRWFFQEAAHRLKGKQLHLARMSAPSFGDETDARALTGTAKGTAVTGELIGIRNGRYLGVVLGFGLAGLNRAQEINPLARKQAALLRRGK